MSTSYSTRNTVSVVTAQNRYASTDSVSLMHFKKKNASRIVYYGYMENILYKILNIAETYPDLATEMTTCMRWIFAVLAAYILLVSIFSLLTTRCTPEIWGYFLVENGGNYPITHWENVIGRSRSADINIPLRTMSNNHVILNRRDENKWILKDLGSHNGTVVNGFKLCQARDIL